jgi:DNA (cytosine-5)-methyltransferase 1
MKYLSLFSGIGGFELGITKAYENIERSGEAIHTTDDKPNSDGRLGGNTQQRSICVGYSEIDKYAIKVYERNFNGHTNYGDCTTINARELPDFDLLVGGFPCQAFSVAGKRKGFDDTRGTLFFDIARILSEKRPRHLLLENVKGLLSHDKGKTYQTILGVLADLGYRVEWQVLNSKNFGVPQNRERIFIIGHLRNECGRKVFPLAGNSRETIGEGLVTVSAVTGVKDVEISPTLDTMYKKGLGSKQARPAVMLHNIYGGFKEGKARVFKDVSPTIRTSKGGGHLPSVLKDSRIRRLTPKECERLQGFPDDWTRYSEDASTISDTQRYKMCGNAVTVNVIEAIMKEFKCLTN